MGRLPGVGAVQRQRGSLPVGTSPPQPGHVSRTLRRTLRRILPAWASPGHLRFLFRGLGTRGALTWIAKELLRPLYYRETCHLLVLDVPAADSHPQPGATSTGYRIVDSRSALAAHRGQIPIRYWEELDSYLREPHRVIVLAVHDSADGAELVGYRQCERGVFRGPGLRVAVPDTMLFVRHNFVLPDHRGQRITQVLGAGTIGYCQQVGVTRVSGIIREENSPSFKAFTRSQSNSVVGRITFTQALGGLYRRTTPVVEVTRMLDSRNRA